MRDFGETEVWAKPMSDSSVATALLNRTGTPAVVTTAVRLHHGYRVVRAAKREFISRSYNLMLRHTFSTRFSDAQCGFKAIRREVATHLLPLVQDNAWFFDTELLVLAERSGLRIHEVPVDWIDDPNSSVHIVSTAMADLRGIGRLARALATAHSRCTTYAPSWAGPRWNRPHQVCQPD